MLNLLSILTFFIATHFQTDLKKVANYSFGKAGTNQYEEFSFWITNKNKPIIMYAYGEDFKDGAKPIYLGKSNIKGKPCFKMSFKGLVLYVIPEKEKLRIKDANGKFEKVFKWQYEGPINGIGTFCSICTQDEKESVSFIKAYYLK